MKSGCENCLKLRYPHAPNHYLWTVLSENGRSMENPNYQRLVRHTTYMTVYEVVLVAQLCEFCRSIDSCGLPGANPFEKSVVQIDPPPKKKQMPEVL